MISRTVVAWRYLVTFMFAFPKRALGHTGLEGRQHIPIFGVSFLWHISTMFSHVPLVPFMIILFTRRALLDGQTTLG
jgi:hypothetical protein